jgi:hypothetical protein
MQTAIHSTLPRSLHKSRERPLCIRCQLVLTNPLLGAFACAFRRQTRVYMQVERSYLQYFLRCAGSPCSRSGGELVLTGETSSEARVRYPCASGQCVCSDSLAHLDVLPASSSFVYSLYYSGSLKSCCDSNRSFLGAHPTEARNLCSVNPNLDYLSQIGQPREPTLESRVECGVISVGEITIETWRHAGVPKRLRRHNLGIWLAQPAFSRDTRHC